MVKLLKSKMFLISILSLLISNSLILTDVVGLEYGVGVNRNDELIWKCKVSNSFELNNLFGSGWDNGGIFNNISKGSKMKWKIYNIETNSSLIKIEVDIWYWIKDLNWGVKDNETQITYLTDPNNYSEGLSFINYTSLVPFWFPIPVGEYMGGLKLNARYNVDNRVLPTLNVDIKKNGISQGYPNEDIKIIAIYNDQGILNSYKLYTKDNMVILDIAYDFLPFYVIPTIVILVSIFTIGIIIYIIKKKKSSKNQSMPRK